MATDYSPPFIPPQQGSESAHPPPPSKGEGGGKWGQKTPSLPGECAWPSGKRRVKVHPQTRSLPGESAWPSGKREVNLTPKTRNLPGQSVGLHPLARQAYSLVLRSHLHGPLSRLPLSTARSAWEKGCQIEAKSRSLRGESAGPSGKREVNLTEIHPAEELA